MTATGGGADGAGGAGAGASSPSRPTPGGARGRLFVAVLPPPSVLDALDELPRPPADGVRWTPRASWHVTLCFLGDADVDDARSAVRRVRHPPVTAVLGPAVSRLGRDVVCVPVAGLDGLARAVVAATAHVGQPPEPRRFAGHLTLARLRHRAACGLAGHAVALRFDVGEIVLVRSHLDHRGARHEPLEVVALEP